MSIIHQDAVFMAPCARNAALIDRVRGEFLEMPGMHLTPPQAARLLAIDHNTCRELLEQLAGAGFLRLTGNGAYARNADQ